MPLAYLPLGAIDDGPRRHAQYSDRWREFTRFPVTFSSFEFP